MEAFKTYIITARTIQGSIEMKFDFNGILRQWINKAELTEEQINWFATHLPTTEDMVEYLKHNKKLFIEVIDFDLSFVNFWEFYGVKIGNKEETRKLWEGFKATNNSRPVTEADKVAIFKKIPKLKYNYQCSKKQLPYPSTFLNQRRWENEF